MGLKGQRLTPEDQLFILTQATLYLSATRGLGAPEMRICYERAEFLCDSVNRPLLQYMAVIGHWRFSLATDKLPAAMKIAKRVYLLAQEHNDPALMMGAYRALAGTLYFLGDFQSARQHAMRCLGIWRSRNVQSVMEDLDAPAVVCLCYRALCEWYLGEISFSQSTMAEAISLAKELNDMHALVRALWFAGHLAHFERNPVEVGRLASDLIELSTYQDFAFWLPGGKVLRGWARAAIDSAAEGISWIEEGIEDTRASGVMLMVQYWLALKAEALYLAERTSEALEAIKEAEALVESSVERWWYAELHRLRGVFLAATDAEETQIEASFCAAINIANQQKSVSLEKRAQATYAEYQRQKASGSGGRGIRLPL
jgi:adenylate cyclase